jgi:hypothetical protein
MQPTQHKNQKLSTPFLSFSHAIIIQQEQANKLSISKDHHMQQPSKTLYFSNTINSSHAIDLSNLT